MRPCNFHTMVIRGFLLAQGPFSFFCLWRFLGMLFWSDGKGWKKSARYSGYSVARVFQDNSGTGFYERSLLAPLPSRHSKKLASSKNEHNKKTFKKKSCPFFSVYPSKIGIYQKKKDVIFYHPRLFVGTLPPQKTPKNFSPQLSPDQPYSPVPSHSLPTDCPIGFPGPNSLGPTSCQERTFQG